MVVRLTCKTRNNDPLAREHKTQRRPACFDVLEGGGVWTIRNFLDGVYRNPLARKIHPIKTGNPLYQKKNGQSLGKTDIQRKTAI